MLVHTKSNKLSYWLADEQATQQFGSALAQLVSVPMHIYLKGHIGAGKTTLIRSLLRNLGVQGTIKSPSYALIEPYELSQIKIYHFDLYRLSAAEELEYLAWRDYFSEQALCCVEWPELAASILPAPDLELELDIHHTGRQVYCQAFSEQGRQLLKELAQVMGEPCGS